MIKNILLVKPISEFREIITPNLGLGYIASSCRKNGYDVNILDCVKDDYDYRKFEEHIKNNSIDLIGFQLYSSDINNVRKSADIVKSVNPRIKIVIGGPHPTSLPKQSLHLSEHFDFGIIGEAEYNFVKLIDYLNGVSNNSINDIPGLIYRKDSEILWNNRAYINNLDDIEMPAWDLINPNSYPLLPHGDFVKAVPVAPIMTSRGCPFECTFCAGPLMFSRKIRYRSIEKVIDEIIYLNKNYGVKEIHIEDDNFTLNKKYVIDFCNLLNKNRLKIHWALPNGIRLNTVDEELLEAIKEAGCYSIAVGIESGSQRILDSIKKKLTVPLIKEKVKLIYNYGLRITGFFIIGFPGETIEDINKTISFSLELPLTKAWFGLFQPLPGTEAYFKLESDKKISNINWDNLLTTKGIYSPDGISIEQLKHFQKKAILKFYMRLPIILKLIFEIRHYLQIRQIILRMVGIYRKSMIEK